MVWRSEAPSENSRHERNSGASSASASRTRSASLTNSRNQDRSRTKNTRDCAPSWFSPATVKLSPGNTTGASCCQDPHWPASIRRNHRLWCIPHRYSPCLPGKRERHRPPWGLACGQSHVSVFEFSQNEVTAFKRVRPSFTVELRVFRRCEGELFRAAAEFTWPAKRLSSCEN